MSPLKINASGAPNLGHLITDASFPNGGDHREPPTQRAPQAPLPGWQIPPQTPYAPGGQSVEWVASSFPLKTPAPDTCLGEAS
ncbi:MAG: hypothetical protein WCB58_09550, partial [Acidobacteriaceae bacterium]